MFKFKKKEKHTLSQDFQHFLSYTYGKASNDIRNTPAERALFCAFDAGRRAWEEKQVVYIAIAFVIGCLLGRIVSMLLGA